MPKSSPWALTVALATALTATATPADAASATSGLEAAPADGAAALARAAVSAQTMYLDVVMDGRVVRPLVRFSITSGQLSVEPAELAAAGLLLPDGLALDDRGLVSLGDVPGLQWQLDMSLQQVRLAPAASLRPTQRFGYTAPVAVEVRRDQGLLLDWDVFARSFDHTETVSLATGVRWFGRLGAIEQTGISRAGGDSTEGYTRLDSRWSYSDPVRLQTWSVGDIVTGGLAWTRPVRLGGVQWRRNFGVRPDLISYPVPQFSADATLPSAVELYVNNVRQLDRQVEPGPFVLTDFPRLVGAGQAMVVVTDALGRRTQINVPLYVDFQRLAPGMSDFSLDAGLLRRGFGVDSSGYGNDPVVSASWRRGLRNDITVELHGESGPGLSLGGAGFAWSPLGRFGLITGSLAHSGGDDSGQQRGLGYQWFGQGVGIDLYSQRASAGYRDLGSLDGGSPPLRAQDRASMWRSIPRGSVSLNWLRSRDRLLRPTRTVSLGLNQSFRRSSLHATALHDADTGWGVSLSLNVRLDRDLDATFSADRHRGDNTFAASARRNAPYEGGWGWEALARDDGDGSVSARRRSQLGDFWFGLDRSGGMAGAFGQGSGSVVMMDGQAFASRRVTDSFALVSTGGVGSVPILYENRLAGTTNDNGYLLLPDVRGWVDNRIGIDPDGLGANLSVPGIEQIVTAPDRGGVRVQFPIQRVRAATVVLHDADGQPVAAGSRVRRGQGGDALVGFDGELWMDAYVDGETLHWSRAGQQCQAVAPPLPTESSRARLGPVICQRES
ncbi:MAG: fimbrial biogenesis outer membrane usher protein, partial [Lysobacter sp.]|nr:fimbrial biogenesis outer membrane usher protein [Lysobacter sp.]